MSRLYDDGSISKQKQGETLLRMKDRIRAAKGYDPTLDKAMSAFYESVSVNNANKEELRMLGHWDFSQRGDDVDQFGKPVETSFLRGFTNVYKAIFGRWDDFAEDRDAQQRASSREVAKLVDAKLEAGGADLSGLRDLETKLDRYVEVARALENLGDCARRADGAGTVISVRHESLRLGRMVRSLVEAYAQAKDLMAPFPEMAGMLPEMTLEAPRSDAEMLSLLTRVETIGDINEVVGPLRNLALDFPIAVADLEQGIWLMRQEMAQSIGLKAEAEAAGKVAAEYQLQPAHMRPLEEPAADAALRA